MVDDRYPRNSEQPRSYGERERFNERDDQFGGNQRESGMGSRDEYRPYGGRPMPDDRADYRRDSDNRGERFRSAGQGASRDERGFFDRAGDEMRSWFGDEEAERRREMDRRYDERHGHASDAHYRSWRSERMGEFDRDYAEYRNENAQRFHDEFTGFRTDRQNQRDGLNRVSEHMEVIGSDGEHVGTVDKVRGERIILTKKDKDAGGHHHSIPSRWIDSVDDKVKLRKTAQQAQDHWRDEDRNGAMFGDDNIAGGNQPHVLNRSFSGTY